MLEADVHAIGLQTAQGTYLTTPFYWDLNDETRAFSKKFAEKFNRPPSLLQAGVYGSTLHYLKAVQAANTDEALAVVFMHGGGLSGSMWETTPDGRPGWSRLFLEAGHPVYVIDGVERGRAGWCR